MQRIDLIPHIHLINLIAVIHPIVVVVAGILRIHHILPTHRIPLTTTAIVLTTRTATAMLPITTVIPPMLPTAIAILHTAVQPQQGVHQVHLEARLEMQDYCLEEQLLLHMGFIRRVPKRKSKTEDRILLARD